MKNFPFMKLLLLIALFLISLYPQQKFVVNLNDRSDGLFEVTLYPKDLKPENKIFNFAATAPGTYQLMDIGQYVRSFKAYDSDGDTIPIIQISINRWKIESPEKVDSIKYYIAQTWNTPVEAHPTFLMSGTTIDSDNVVINGQAVFGFFDGHQSDSIQVELENPKDWKIGTALNKIKDGLYSAKTYDEIVDSPIMLGRLSTASTKVDDAEIEVYTYSQNDLIKSEDILSALEDILKAESEFTKGLPVDRYTFLFHFDKHSAGAWEHKKSSFYVLREKPLDEQELEAIREMSSHEFFHIVTPLNIHSEIIEKFNFINPVESQHLWLYEGVTEWAAQIMLMRAGVVSLEEHLATLKRKLTVNDFFDKDISLKELALHSLEMQDQYPNIYYKGAITAELLDIKLLELSNGKKGLREILNELANKYGTNKSFSEEGFFDEFVDMTYQEIKDFINDYILGTKELPVKEYFKKLGIDYYESKGIDSSSVSLGAQFGLKDSSLIVFKVTNPESGLEKGDILSKVNDEEVNLISAMKIFRKLKQMKIGNELKLTVLRNGKEVETIAKVKATELKHVFEIDENPPSEQLHLRETWMKNL